jgi:uncharacterized protein YndB with AHSA1/START domain
MSDLDNSVEFVISRVFNAPRELVFKSMTETDHLQHWWGPAGCTLEVARNEPKAGGEFLYKMVFPGGFGMWGKFQYQEVSAPERIVWINSFADADGNTTPNPMAPDWPVEMMNVLTLEEQGAGTLMTLRSQPHQASEEQAQVFKSNHASLEQGFGGMYEVYEAYLAKL